MEAHEEKTAKSPPPAPPTAPPPEPKLDGAFWAGLVETHRQLDQKKRTERFQSFRIT